MSSDDVFIDDTLPPPPKFHLGTSFERLLALLIVSIEQLNPTAEPYTTKKKHILYTLRALKDSKFLDYIQGRQYTYSRLKKLIETGYFSLDTLTEEHLDTLFHYAQLFVKELSANNKETTPEEVEIYCYRRDPSILSAYEKALLLRLETAFSGLNSQDEEAKNWEKKIATYRQELKKKYSEYNFVCLSRAFVHLLQRKQKELCIQKITLTLLGAAGLSVPSLMAYLGISSTITNSSQAIDIKPYISLLACTLLILYYFRINLKMYFNTKSQILQIEQRRAVCAFFEGYNEYKTSKRDMVSEKFEALIFSPIVPDSNKIPSTFDGLEQLTNLIKACTKSK